MTKWDKLWGEEVMPQHFQDLQKLAFPIGLWLDKVKAEGDFLQNDNINNTALIKILYEDIEKLQKELNKELLSDIVSLSELEYMDLKAKAEKWDCLEYINQKVFNAMIPELKNLKKLEHHFETYETLTRFDFNLLMEEV